MWEVSGTSLITLSLERAELAYQDQWLSSVQGRFSWCVRQADCCRAKWKRKKGTRPVIHLLNQEANLTKGVAKIKQLWANLVFHLPVVLLWNKLFKKRFICLKTVMWCISSLSSIYYLLRSDLHHDTDTETLQVQRLERYWSDCCVWLLPRHCIVESDGREQRGYKLSVHPEGGYRAEDVLQLPAEEVEFT